MKLLDYETLDIELQENTSSIIKCHKGCHYCCHYDVGVTVQEVTLIFQYLINHPDIVIKVKNALQENRFCAFLDNTLCSIYEVRPIICRGWNSVDILVCEQSNEKEPTAIPHKQLLYLALKHQKGLSEKQSLHKLLKQKFLGEK